MNKPGKPFLTFGLISLLSACVHQPDRIGRIAESRAEHHCESIRSELSQTVSAQRFNAGLPQHGQWRDGFDLADMNRDGHVDLIFPPARKSLTPPKIFLNDGKARFSEWKPVHFPPLPYDYGDIKAADLNKDGLTDLVLASHLRGVAALIQEVEGSFAPWGEGLEYRAPGQMPGELSFSSRAIAVTDWNGDQAPDILALNEGPSRFAEGQRNTEALALFLNRFGAWERVIPKQVLNSFGDSIAVGDIDGNGHMDAFLGSQFSGTRLLLQLGDGNSFQPTELRSLPLDAAVTAVALHDFDRDGLSELINATRAVGKNGFCMGLQINTRAADGEERSQTLWRESSKDSIRSLLVLDVNQDGRDDLLAFRTLGGVLVFLGSARGFQWDATISYSETMESCQAFDAMVADLDRDGGMELVIAFAGEDTGTDAMPCKNGGGIEAMRLEFKSTK